MIPDYRYQQAPPPPVASPCIDLCEMGSNGLCKGCLRTIDEIVAWGSASDDFKRAVLGEIKIRETQLEFK